MISSILICLATFVVLLWMLRRDELSMGLPLAYLASLLLIHVPGAFAHTVSHGFLFGVEFVEIGIRLTAIASVCFVLGVGLARLSARATPGPRAPERGDFWTFCLFGGWLMVYGLSPLGAIPSLGAAIDKGGAVWLLGVLLGLRAAMFAGDAKKIAAWLLALVVYPILTLLIGGFLSYGSTAIIVVGAALAVAGRSPWKVVAGVVAGAIVGLNVFVNYFQHRDAIRGQVWGGASIGRRIDSVADMFRDFHLFNAADPHHLVALDQRLNQNLFAGLAAKRLQSGEVSYLQGRSILEGLQAVVPRVFWPDKPVFGGSPKIVSEMTGLHLNTNTSFGVGNVMEFDVNFGVPGVIAGFLLLGWLIGFLDRKAASAERRGALGQTFLYFLPCIALIQPNGSMVELFGGSVAGLVAAFGWRWAWTFWSQRRTRAIRTPRSTARRSA